MSVDLVHGNPPEALKKIAPSMVNQEWSRSAFIYRSLMQVKQKAIQTFDGETEGRPRFANAGCSKANGRLYMLEGQWKWNS